MSRILQKKIFIPRTVGGGIRNLHDIEEMLKNGADKVSINSAGIDNIKFIKEASRIFGSSTIVSNIECINVYGNYFISKSNGRDLVNVNPIKWAQRLEGAGIGEIIITSVNNDGLQKGFDIKLISKVSKSVNVPTIASGGAGTNEHVLDVINKPMFMLSRLHLFFITIFVVFFNTKKQK